MRDIYSNFVDQSIYIYISPVTLNRICRLWRKLTTEVSYKLDSVHPAKTTTIGGRPTQVAVFYRGACDSWIVQI